MYNNLDKQPIITNVKRRKNKVYNFYYSTYGQIIKRRRLELNKTQEAVAESICSNTYISKAENNQVVIGEDQLNLIMEKLNISKQEFANPETLIYYLGRVIEYYYFKDIESYQKLIQRIEGYHFHALVQIMKLGFYILTKQYEDAIYIYHQLLDYLNSMDELAFSVYLTFSADLCIKNNQINLAKFLIDTVFQIHIDYHELRCLYSYIKYKIYGRIDMPIAAMGIYSSLIEMVADTGNQLLIKELVLHKAILSELYSEKKSYKYFRKMIKDVDDDLVDEFLLLKAFNSDDPKLYVSLMNDKQGKYHMIGLYLLARHELDKNNQQGYENILDEISKYGPFEDIDFKHLLEISMKDEWGFYKEYLINPCLKVAKKHQNIFFIKYISKKISEVLEDNKRYKDALNYLNQADKHVDKIKYNY